MSDIVSFSKCQSWIKQISIFWSINDYLRITFKNTIIQPNFTDEKSSASSSNNFSKAIDEGLRIFSDREAITSLLVFLMTTLIV